MGIMYRPCCQEMIGAAANTVFTNHRTNVSNKQNMSNIFTSKSYAKRFMSISHVTEHKLNNKAELNITVNHHMKMV